MSLTTIDGSLISSGAITLTTQVTGTLPVANGGTGVTTSTGSGTVVLSASPTFTGTPSAPTATNGTNTTQLATTAFAYGTFSAGGSGYQKLASGLIIQWSNVVGTSPCTVTFPITFPNTYLAYPFVTNGDYGNSASTCGVTGLPTNSSFQLATNSGGVYRWVWVCIGY